MPGQPVGWECAARSGANGLSSTAMTVSRLQRDLSDSSAIRNVGVGVGHSYLALLSALRGLKDRMPD